MRERQFDNSGCYWGGGEGECGEDSLTTVVVAGVGGEGECGEDSLTTVVVAGVGGGVSAGKTV